MKRKQVYISASSRGLGFEVALSFALDGHEVALSSRRAKHLELAKEKITEKIPTAKIRTYAGNLSCPKDQIAIINAMTNDSFSPDVFVCSSGQPIDLTLDNIDHDTWLNDIEMIPGQAVFAAQRFIPHMVARGYGRFIFISSVWTKNPCGNYLAGSMARAGLYVMSKAIVNQYAASHVASFVINLGFMDTPLLRNMALGRDNDATDPADIKTDRPWQKKYNEWKKIIPANKIGSVKDFAALVKFLSTPEAEYCNGSVFSFSGGMDKNLL